ncbi:MAG: hypothetical protein K6F53_12180 [Lachnospiraceae bacterium]|nr:hypothetical protein [Lachnospiraceae bacterium]
MIKKAFRKTTAVLLSLLMAAGLFAIPALAKEDEVLQPEITEEEVPGSIYEEELSLPEIDEDRTDDPEIQTTDVLEEEEEESLSEESFGADTVATLSEGGGEAREYTNLEDAIYAWETMGPRMGATLKLMREVSVEKELKVKGGSEDAPMVLDLNGYGIINSGSNSTRLITVESGGYFVLEDTRQASRRFIVLNENRGTSAQSNVPSGGDFVEVKTGYLTGGKHDDGGCISNAGTFVMNGGSIVGNLTVSGNGKGGGVYSTGIFRMNGGWIATNTAGTESEEGKGGGVYIGSGKFIIRGGEISGNRAGAYSALFYSRDHGAKCFFDGDIYESSASTVSARELKRTLSTRGYVKVQFRKKIEVERNHEIREYADLSVAAEAWNAMGAGTSMRLLEDVETEDTVEVTEGDRRTRMILNLNDHGILYYGEGSVIHVAEGKGLNLKDQGTSATTRYIRMTDGRGVAVKGSAEEAGSGCVKVTGGYLTGGYIPMSGDAPDLDIHSGGGVRNDGIFVFESGTIAGNRAAGYGGGVFSNGEALIKNGVICNNRSDLDGGGVYNRQGLFTISGNGVIRDNEALSGNGGGMYNCADLEIFGGAIYGNSVRAEGAAGGGIYLASGAMLNMTLGEIKNNTGADAQKGRAIYAEDSVRIYFPGLVALFVSENLLEQNASYEDAQKVRDLINSYGFIRAERVLAGVTGPNGERLFGDMSLAVRNWNDVGRGAVLTLYACVETTKTIEVNGGDPDSPMVLKLNGCGILNKSAGSVIHISAGHALRLTDGGRYPGERWIKLSGHRGVGVTENPSDAGSESLTVYGGYIAGGSVKEEDGVSYGSGVYNEGTFLMDEGTILANTAENGGGVFSTGTFKMTGGAIRGNHASSGGGAYIGNGTFTMEGGELRGNTADVKAEALFTGSEADPVISGGTIAGGNGSVSVIICEGSFSFTDAVIYAGNNDEGEGAILTDTAVITKQMLQNYRYLSADAEIVASVTIDCDVTTEYHSFEKAVEAWNNAGGEATLTLLENVVIKNPIEANGGSDEGLHILDLNDHGIRMAGTSYAIETGDNSHVVLADRSPTHTVRYITLTEGIGTGESLEKPSEGTDFVEVTGGYITGGNGPYAGGVWVYNGEFRMEGGTIVGNSAMDGSPEGGGGISCNRGVFEMTGGEICHNRAPIGGGVSVLEGEVRMKGGLIRQNVSSGDGGGIFVNSASLIISGGRISGNNAEGKGGGVALKDGESVGPSFEMLSGEIAGNTAKDGGNAVYVYFGRITFARSVLAGQRIDGSDAKSVNAAKLSDSENLQSYGYLALSALRIDPVPAQRYTGKAITPEIGVYFGDRLLVKNRDYTIKFSNNVKVDSSAKFKITGKGNYKGTYTDKFEIIRKNIDADDISISEVRPAVYNRKKTYEPVPTVTYKGRKLKNNKDFRVFYFDSLDNAEAHYRPIRPKNAGTYYIMIEGENNFDARVIREFRILDPESEEAKQIPVGKLTVGKIKNQKYTGEQVRPAPVVKTGKTLLKEGTHYTLNYGENTEAGTGTVEITGIAPYTGTRTVSFRITGIPMKKVTVKDIPKSVVYDGSPKMPEVKLSYKANKKAAAVTVNCVTEEDYEALSTAGKAAVGCIVSYQNNIKAGTATVVLKGIHGYEGTVKKTFKILPFTVTKDPDDLFRVRLDNTDYFYAKAGVKPKPEVTFGDVELVEGVDYTLSYANNTAVYDPVENTGAGTKTAPDGAKKSRVPVVKVTGKGNFKGTDTAVAFTIKPVSMESAGISLEAKDIVCSKKAGGFKTKFTLTDPDGKALKDGTDYDSKKAVYSRDESGTDVIPDNEKISPGTTVYVTVAAKGLSYTGSVTGSYRVLAEGHDISKLKYSVRDKHYTGQEIRLSAGDITWKSGKKAVEGVDFEIISSSYKNNLFKGKATVIVRGTGEWGGIKKITFKIASRGLLW